MDLTCEVTREDLDLLCSPGPAVNSYLTFPGNLFHQNSQIHRKSEGVTAPGGPREVLSQYGGGSRATGGPQGTQ